MLSIAMKIAKVSRKDLYNLGAPIGIPRISNRRNKDQSIRPHNMRIRDFFLKFFLKMIIVSRQIVVYDFV